MLLYPLRLVFLPQRSGLVPRLGGIRVPSAFDPAAVLYPVVLPVLVALSLSESRPGVLLPNIMLGLAALPARLIPRLGLENGCNPLHWLITLLPLLMSRITPRSLQACDNEPNTLDVHYPQTLHLEILALLFPLHQFLLMPLKYLTTSSLLVSELQLLSIALINLLLLSTSPQAVILQSVIWIGGPSIFVWCAHVLRWNVALERIPKRRFRQSVKAVDADDTLLSTLARGLNIYSRRKDIHASYADSDEDYLGRNTRTAQSHFTTERKQERPRSVSSVQRNLESSISIQGNAEWTLLSGPVINLNESGNATFQRRSTLPSLLDGSTLPHNLAKQYRQKRSMSLNIQEYLKMTPAQANARKWLYAGYIYTFVIFIILIIIRDFVASRALRGYEPIGWAVGYLFGDIGPLRILAITYSLEKWIVFPSLRWQDAYPTLEGDGWVQHVRHSVLGEANTRLALFAYWTGILSLGIITVLRSSSVIEVDTRRKVFHGMMVTMLLPTTFVDPAFLSLGLILVLAVFLLLELFRAAQLKPLSKPLAQFLTPYVDGRDLCGPVIVSHIFLLIGCAIPLWLSLAAIGRTGDSPWEGWEITTRDVSMVSGVICVGMGDAAASLVGRRFGQHKWPWAGGKSLEGSAAFAFAVTLGLVSAKAWLRAGGWQQTIDDYDSWITIIAKSVIAASGASFTEAVLTGCNDNVIVPIVLWLLVRGLQL